MKHTTFTLTIRVYFVSGWEEKEGNINAKEWNKRLKSINGHHTTHEIMCRLLHACIHLWSEHHGLAKAKANDDFNGLVFFNHFHDHIQHLIFNRSNDNAVFLGSLPIFICWNYVIFDALKSQNINRCIDLNFFALSLLIMPLFLFKTAL